MNIKEIKENTYCITVPRGIRYLSQWQDFGILPFPHILDKQIPGCGFTEFCLTNNQDLVLMSPRKILLENKYEQHKDDIYYVINSYEKIVGSDKDITKDSINQKLLEQELNCTIDSEEIQNKKTEFYLSLKNSIKDYIIKRKCFRLPFKIIVTYDSFYLVKQILKELDETSSEFESIQFVVDEFQSIFTDATFKSDTELNYLTVLSGVNKLCFVSATPMIEEYLRMVDIFKDLPYYELDWSSDDLMRVKKPRLKIRSSRSAITTAKEIVKSYLDNKFDYKFICKNGKTNKIYSEEAVIYMNSVNNILTVIKGMNLKPEQVNILCSDTPENQNRIRKRLGKDFNIGKVPLKGDPHKMFTFCTRTVYLGADFYSTNARSFIISDANIDTLAVDISLDLPQILGRQRLIENPWKDEAIFYYKSTCNNKTISKEELDKVIKEKLERTDKLLSIFEKGNIGEQVELAINYEIVAKTNNYKRNYVAVNSIYIDSKTVIKKPLFNNLVMIAERRAFDIQQVDYADRFNMFSEIEENNIIVDSQINLVKFFEEYESLSTFQNKLKFLCEFDFPDNKSKLEILDHIKEKHFKEYYEICGPERCKELGYTISKINKELNIKSFNKSDLILSIYSNFNVGDKYSLNNIKLMLSDIYVKCGYEKSPVASDLREYFELKENIKIKDSTGKWVRGFEILNYKYDIRN